MPPERSRGARSGDELHGVLEPPAGGCGSPGTVVIRLDDGRRVLIPADLLIGCDGVGFDASAGPSEGDRPDAKDEVRIPAIAEEVWVGKRRVETGRVRASKVVRSREQVVDEPLARDEVSVERIPVNRAVDGPVAVRKDGDTLIVPLLEEVLVVEKRLMLREELRITTRRIVERKPRAVSLRSEDVVVERLGRPGPSDRPA